jgi:hypothetical protein
VPPSTRRSPAQEAPFAREGVRAYFLLRRIHTLFLFFSLLFRTFEVADVATDDALISDNVC